MSKPLRFVLSSLLCVFFAAGGSLATADCEPVDGISSICDLEGPEDLVLVPGGRFLVFSQMSAGRGLSSLDTRNDSVRSLYPGAELRPELGWGDPACSGEPGADILAHGIDLRLRLDGRLQLLVVNHGGRESIEFFELLRSSDGYPELDWKGCVRAPEDALFNDVVGLSDGGFLVTHMFSRSAQTWSAIKSLLGFNTGWVYRWRAQDGFSKVPGTDVPMANGIALAEDERHFFLNVYIGNEVRKYALEGGAPVVVASVKNPDNSSWDSRGSLLVASHQYTVANLLDGIPRKDGSPVPLHFAIIEMDPDTLQSTVLFEHEGPPMGGATAAVPAAGSLYIGSYTGDRLIKVPMEQMH